MIKSLTNNLNIMGMNAIPTNNPIEKTTKTAEDIAREIEDIQSKIVKNRENWEEAERQNYALRTNVSAPGGPVDYEAAARGNVSAQDSASFRQEGINGTAREMERLDREKGSLDEQLLGLRILKPEA